MNYKYYLRRNGRETYLYRTPNNEKTFYENIEHVEYFENGIWTKNSLKIRTALNEIMTGWFDEDDQISDVEAMKIQRNFKKNINNNDL